ncbi:MAG: CDP-diacylglycerol--serine O-phosphatidyltransferase [Desulfurivibrionaceae bacterium]|nr:CDP-diacylglycerol--serine O-phosphatidyltransferase [Desulfobulbales bacterium]MDT8335639.1 CDP-diacylglycerol--serine O-phosphatidyltransferase [Desulfurivibrionaceae bacterium]
MTDALKSTRSDGPKGTICLVPSMLTTISLFSGFYAIISAINGFFFHAAVALIISAVFDGLDGRVARMTGTTSLFGKEYDSLCDLVAFGVAPAIITYLWTLVNYGRYGGLAAFLFVATTALRLARFNIQDSGSNKNFTGLPCPAAAGFIATTILFCNFMGISASSMGLVMLAVVYALSYLMVSSVPYLSFKKPEISRTRKFQGLVGMVLLIMVIASQPEVTLFVMAVLYIFSGPYIALYRLLAKCRKKEGLAERKSSLFRP